MLRPCRASRRNDRIGDDGCSFDSSSSHRLLFRALADEMFGSDETALGKALESGAIVEVECDEQDVQK